MTDLKMTPKRRRELIRSAPKTLTAARYRRRTIDRAGWWLVPVVALAAAGFFLEGELGATAWIFGALLLGRVEYWLGRFDGSLVGDEGNGHD